MSTHSGRLLYLALADARGHLMRAHLLSGALAEAGLAVDIVTTSREGVHFLASMGRQARLLSEHFRVEFGDRHDMSRPRTDARVLSYLLLPWRALGDLRRLARLARGADLVVNDSLHPALLLAPALGFSHPVAQVYGENLWWATEANLDDRAPPRVAARRRRWRAGGAQWAGPRTARRRRPGWRRSSSSYAPRASSAEDGGRSLPIRVRRSDPGWRRHLRRRGHHTGAPATRALARVLLLFLLVSARPGPILVVDASSERLRASVAVLRHGFGAAAVRGTSDHEDALGWIACERPAVLVTPADTAKASGAALVEELRGRWGPVPVVVTHGPGFNALPPPVVHLPAPVDPVQLRSEVGRWVAGAGAGTIATTLLSDVLALYARAGRTGVLDVHAPARTGSVWFEDGDLVHAACGAHTGATALFEVLCWNEGRFAFRRTSAPDARSLSGSLPELLARADSVGS